MITKKEKLSADLARLPFSECRDAWIDRARIESGRIANYRDLMLDMGFEIIDESVPDAALLTSDGREILAAHGRRWALRQDIHKQRMNDALERAKQSKIAEADVVSKTPVAEGLGVVTCPQMADGRPCGGALNRTPVCPSCVTGRMGYKYRYTCESCGFDVVTKTELPE